ncbi:alpha/beta hydrolase [Microbacterium tumbae]
MDIEQVHPQLQGMARNAPKLDVGSRFMRAVARLGSRYLLPRAHVPGVVVRDVREGDARLRLYTPEGATGAALLWIHGGGMVIGAPRQDDRFCAETAARLGITIASADYRLAPEHPYPTPVEDCRAVWEWLLRNVAALGIDPDRIAVGGGSAGAGLAAALVHALHDNGETQPIAQWLLYPMIDDRTAADSALDGIDHYVWNNVSNRIGWTAYLRGIAEPGSDAVPAEAAPARREDLTGLPPTWVGVGDIDLFHREDTVYARRLRDAGVPVQLDVLAGAPHGFESLAPEAPVVREFVDTAREWLADATRSRA